MNNVIIPAGYKPSLSVYDTQRAIEFIKKDFQHNLLRIKRQFKRLRAPGKL